MPEVSKSITIWVRVGSTMSRHSMSREVGIGSSLHVSGVEFCTNLRTMFSETGSKNISGFPGKRLPKDGSENCGPNSFWIFTLLLKKKIRENVRQVRLRKYGR